MLPFSLTQEFKYLFHTLFVKNAKSIMIIYRCFQQYSACLGKNMHSIIKENIIILSRSSH